MCCREVSFASGSSAYWLTAAAKRSSHSRTGCSPPRQTRRRLARKRPPINLPGDAPGVPRRCESDPNLRLPNSLSNATTSTARSQPPATFRRKDVGAEQFFGIPLGNQLDQSPNVAGRKRARHKFKARNRVLHFKHASSKINRKNQVTAPATVTMVPGVILPIHAPTAPRLR